MRQKGGRGKKRSITRKMKELHRIIEEKSFDRNKIDEMRRIKNI
jgi:Spy/CpxP family protein refolding chaperone